MEIIEGERSGSIMYVYEGFVFRRKSKIKEKMYISCTFNGCEATAHIQGEDFILKRPHNHAPEDMRVEKLRLRSDLRKAAEKYRGLGMKRAFEETCKRLDQRKYCFLVLFID
ncbi:hypothetical protein J6590_014165 [Homalodisca vitripennis]|nr:hypothetical protein J6590_014165 [Homalodisca vitripennis]